MYAVPDAVAAKAPHLPESPGVYLWKDADGRVLYVGKAKRLRSRVRSYFAADLAGSVKTQALVRQVADLDTIVVPTEAHALILEATLIKEYQPRYNIALRDDKSYPYIKVTVEEPFPRVFVTRQVKNDGARYFGPYTDVGAMRRALNVVKQLFTVRSCRYDMPREMPERACLDYYIKRCKGPCILAQTQADYRAMIDEVIEFLEGRTGDVIAAVKERMASAAARMDFERAGELRDALARLVDLEEPTVVMEVEGGDRDVVGYARDGDDACVALLRIRGGKLLARDHRLLENVEGEPDAAVLAAYLTRTYIGLPDRASELIAPFDFEDREALETALAQTRIVVPQRGPKRHLIELADQNARHLLEEFRLAGAETDERAVDPVYELQRELGLQHVPRSIVCFDVSHAQGTDTVASLVWFENGRPKRAEYRKFKIVGETGGNEEGGGGGNDDYASMGEVVERYFRRRLDDGKPLPDLVVVDGGKGQLGAARTSLAGLELADLPVISLAKQDEEVFTVGHRESIRLSRRSPALKLLQQARDEAHRFAVTFQRKRRSARTVTSQLLQVPGIGPVKRRQLLAAFGSVHGVREAPVERIAALPGWTLSSAARLLAALENGQSTVPQGSAVATTAAEP